ncbi:hypothetical protein, partial [Streptomyces sp. NPDC058872]|uniref:hypothetical protein n=1 Tax=Streptomyces sp. NPDC058872 TaxID=3346661 RepID=UPI0036CB7DC2
DGPRSVRPYELAYDHPVPITSSHRGSPNPIEPTAEDVSMKADTSACAPHAVAHRGAVAVGDTGSPGGPKPVVRSSVRTKPTGLAGRAR